MAEEQETRIGKQKVSTAKWEEAQKTAFTHWINTMLARRKTKIDDLQTGFQDGVKLIVLSEVLVGKAIGQRFVEKPKLKAHKINNAYIALKFLQDVGGLKHLTISAENLVAAEFLNLILGFCWQLLKTFQEPPDFDDGEGNEKGKGANTYEARMLGWVKNTLGDKYPDIDLTDGFKSGSFQNGKALLALISEFDENIKYAETSAGDAHANCKTALDLANDVMHIPAIIDADELADGYVGDKQLVLYLSLMYNAFTDKQKGASVESLASKLTEREAHLRLLKEENLKLKEATENLTTNLNLLQSQYDETSENHANLSLASKETEEKLSALKEEWGSCKEEWSEEISKLKSQLATMMEADDEQCQSLQSEWDKSQDQRDKLREELKKAKEQLTKEKEELEAKNKRLLKNEKRARKNKEELEDIMKNQQEVFDLSMEEFRKHFLVHINDINTWRPYLEEDREYVAKEISLPEEKSEAAFNDQVSELLGVCKAENRTLQELLTTYEIETAEIVSVTIGVKQKRTKQYAWEQEFPEDLKSQIVRATSAALPKKGLSTTSASPRGLSPRKDKEEKSDGSTPRGNKKRDGSSGKTKK
eukprot:TRINITY_DN344_c0_g1_i1.p1 TRINITY_DN344_c0_g1~~TRINITY_DN344_c0_g1_i1.p1  ORF type:complete len:599 (+),score=212.16 TRINITY_DN344_c0_g1_i1:30-1799(+)